MTVPAISSFPSISVFFPFPFILRYFFLFFFFLSGLFCFVFAFACAFLSLVFLSLLWFYLNLELGGSGHRKIRSFCILSLALDARCSHVDLASGSEGIVPWFTCWYLLKEFFTFSFSSFLQQTGRWRKHGRDDRTSPL